MQNVSFQDLSLALLWRRSLLYGNQSIDLQSKSIDWFLYHRGFHHERFKDAHSDLRQFLATESPLKVMKKDFYFTLKGLFVLKLFEFLS